MKLGIQLWTMRDVIADETYVDTLAALADIGFQGVEFAWNYGGMAAQELACTLDRLGLACCGLHISLEEILDPASESYAIAQACGSRYVTTSLANRTDEFPALAPKLNEAGRVASSRGVQFTYHNHHQEFTVQVEGVAAQDYLTANTDPELVGLEIDIGWAKKGGRDPMAYWRQFGTRAPQIHLRDYSDEQEDMTDVGDGFIDLAAVKAQGEASGTTWLIFEQGKYAESALQSCIVCAARVRNAGLV